MNNGLQLIGMDVSIKTDQYLAPPLVQCGASVVTYRNEAHKQNSIFKQDKVSPEVLTTSEVWNVNGALV
jgi:hypothetical protein